MLLLPVAYTDCKLCTARSPQPVSVSALGQRNYEPLHTNTHILIQLTCIACEHAYILKATTNKKYNDNFSASLRVRKKETTTVGSILKNEKSSNVK